MVKISTNQYYVIVDGGKHFIDAKNMTIAKQILSKRLSNINKKLTLKEIQEKQKEALREEKRQEAKRKIEAIEWKALRHLWERELGGATSLTNEEYIEVLTTMKQFREESNKDE